MYGTADSVPGFTNGESTTAPTRPPPSALDSVVVRFAGDSGDGMQLTGGRFTLSTALAGNDLATFPDFPAEIRAPQGTTFGVSAFQINFGSASIETAGDAPDVLLAMNPAALKVNLADLRAAKLDFELVQATLAIGPHHHHACSGRPARHRALNGHARKLEKSA